MTSVQIHLALTHVPVILSISGLIMLIVAFFMKNKILTTASYVMILVAGIGAIPVFLTGEGAEEVVEKIPGISEALMERHEEVAKLAMISIAAASFTALAALLASKWKVATQLTRIAVLVFASFSAGLIVQTAHLGGQIRHTEITKGIAMETGANTNGDNQNNGSQQPDDDARY